jgi:hypothetical protein
MFAGAAKAAAVGFENLGEDVARDVTGFARGAWARLVRAARGGSPPAENSQEALPDDDSAPLEPGSSGTPLEDAGAAVAANPGDGDAIAALRFQIRLLLQADPVLSQQVESDLKSAPESVQTVIASGAAAVAIGGSSYAPIRTSYRGAKTAK